MTDPAHAASTRDPRDPITVRADVERLFAMLDGSSTGSSTGGGWGGVGIVPLDVAYAICATRDAAVKRIFKAKNRSYDKPSGMLANACISRALHQLEPWKHDLVDTLVSDADVPFSVVAPFRADHTFLAGVDTFVLESSTKAGTLDMLINAGQFHDEVARQAWARGVPVFGSSANTSLTGSKFRYADIEAPVRAAADIHFDYGRSAYANPEGRSSTIVDFRDFSVLRVGTRFEAVAAAFARHGGVELRA